jgi:uncharacterized phage protein (TIGR02220 family)
MAKRFVESRIFDDVWFQELSAEWKLLWWYLLCKCDEAGMWKVNYKLAEFQIGKKINWDKTNQMINKNKERIKFYPEFWVLADFVIFQYGEKAYTSENPFHKKIRQMLDRVSKRVSNIGCKQHPQVEEEVEVKVKVKEEDIFITIIKDLNYICNTNYKPTTPKTRELIKARLKEGFTTDDFKIVHRKMTKLWGNDPEMVGYLRPQTLYGTKFESYLQKIIPTNKLSRAGSKAMQVGQEWLKEKEEEENGKK